MYTSDGLDRKEIETVHYPDFSKTFRDTYHDNGLKNTFTMPGGPTYEYTYNDNDHVTRISIPGVGEISYPSYTLSRPDSVEFPGGITESYQYDTLMRLEQINASTLNYAYSYDHVSNILTKTTEHGNYVYDYDDVYRVTDVDNPIQDDEAYTYDGVGNRETASGVSGAITHNANNELEVYGDITYEYDANGNLIRQSLDSVAVIYTYNVANRLIQVEDDATATVIAEYGYDPFGRRLWKEVDGTRTYFFYADEGLVAEYDATGNEIRSYGYQPDSTWTTDPLFLREGSEYYWYQNDHLGTPQKLVDGTGTVVWSATYTAFGEAQIDVEAVTNNLRFPGQYYDAETGLHYNWFRYYDSRLGKYFRTDPLQFHGGDVNWYVYAGVNPINLTDRMGLADCTSDNVGAKAKRDFFNWLYHQPPCNGPYRIWNLPTMAQELGIDEYVLIRFAASEASWQNPPVVREDASLQHNIDLNNPFGMTNRGKENLEFGCVAEAMAFWMTQPGGDISYVQRIKTIQAINIHIPFYDLLWPGWISPADFADAILCEGPLEGKCHLKQNADPKGWRKKFYDISPKKWKDACSEVCNLE